MPILSRIEIENFKAIEKADVSFSDWVTIVVGGNNAGKSSILQAMQVSRVLLGLPMSDPLLSENQRAYLAEVVRERAVEAMVTYTFRLVEAEASSIADLFLRTLTEAKSIPSGVTHKDATALPTSFKATVRIRRDQERFADIWLSQVALELKKGAWVPVYSQSSHGAGPSGLLSLVGVAGAAKASSLTYRPDDGLPEFPGHIVGVSSPPSQWLTQVPARYHYLSFFVEFVRNCLLVPAARHYARSSNLSETRTGYVGAGGLVELPQLLAELSTNYRDDLEVLERAVSRVLPEVTAVFGRTDRAKADARIGEKGGVSAESAYPAWQAGSAVSHVLTCLALALRQPPSSVLLIEEPELSLHAGAQRHLLDELSRVAGQRSLQLVLTTHSPAFVRGSKLHVVACRRDVDGRVSVGEATVLEELIPLLGLEPGDALVADCLLVVEGPTEKCFYDAVLRSQTSPMRHWVWRIVDLGGDDRGLHKYLHVLHQATLGVADRILLLDRTGQSGSLPPLEGWEVVQWQTPDGRPGDFEDQFTSAEMSDALNALLPEDSHLQVGDLEKPGAGGGGLRRSQKVERLFERRTKSPLNKAAFGTSLAQALLRRTGAGEGDWAAHKALAPIQQVALRRTQMGTS